LGNRTQENIDQPLSPVPNLTSESISYSYDIVNRIQSAGNVTYGFDANGNMTSRNDGGNITNFGFNAENMITNINASEVTFTYDVFGNRRAAVRNSITNRYVLDIQGNMSQVIIEKDQSNNPLNYYIYGIGLVARIKPDGTTHYYHGDFRGSIIAMTNASGTITHKYSYDAFGNTIDQVEPDYNPFKYVGLWGVMEETNGLHFMRARYYDPKIGRFISEDPVWDFNLYEYANSNPLTNIDPKGTLPNWLYKKTGWADNPDVLLGAKVGNEVFSILASLTPGGAAFAIGLNAAPTVGKIWKGELTSTEALSEATKLSIYQLSTQLESLISLKTNGIDFLHTKPWGNQMNFINKGVEKGMGYYFHLNNILEAIIERRNR
jgi:RHS repeat-associated protein